MTFSPVYWVDKEIGKLIVDLTHKHTHMHTGVLRLRLKE